jgi:hypothetical protein
MFGAAIAALLFILTLFLKWVSVGPVSASGTDFGAWWIALLIALVGGGILAADALGVDLPVRMPVTSVATYLMSLLVFYVVIFIFAADSLSYGVWLALIFSVVAFGLAYSLHRDDTR